VGLALALLRLAATQYPLGEIDTLIALLAEPAGSIAAGLILIPIARRERRPLSLMLTPGLLFVAATLDMVSAQGLASEGTLAIPMALAWLAVMAVGLPMQIHVATRQTIRLYDRLRKRSETELRETQDRFRALTESAFDLVAELDAEERFTYVNPRYTEVLGMPAETFLGRVPRDFLHPDDAPAAMAFADEATGGVATGLLTRARHRDGGFRWLESSARGFTSSDGTRRWVMNSRDVTERVARDEQRERDHERLEEAVTERTRALAESEARFRALADHAPELVSEFDQDGRYTFANAAFRELLGREPVGLIGTTPEELIHPADLPESREAMTHALRQMGAAHALHRLRHANGSWRWFDNTGRAYRTAPGELRFVSIGRDVTEARQADEERRRLHEHMQEAQRLESLGVLAGGIAHDFNNLLAVILGNLAVLREDAERDPDTAERLRRIRAAAHHAEDLTEQMLAYAGHSVAEITPLDLSQLIRDTGELLRASVPKHCRLVFELSDAPQIVEGDTTQLRQVLVNLVLNAAEALGGDPGRVWIRTETRELDAATLADGFGSTERAPGAWITLEVADDGPGMDEGQRRRVFEPFYSTKRSGRGLGLAAVLGIAGAHRGVLRVESAPNRGTVFQLLLPPCEGRPQRVDASDRSRVATPQSGRVLVVDDEEAVREVAQLLLQRGGLQVETAEGGDAALARVRSKDDLDAVLLDLAMPDRSGADVLRAIRAERPHLPVVIASGYKRDVAGRRSNLEGAFSFVPKPYDPDVLLEALRKAVASRRSGEKSTFYA
jgi:two-component system cell cycle sensor histidine kinase/response regulator CckA